MNREEMLRKLHSIEFTLIWPPSEWEDIGFTEREIWVNSKGYGYIMCDEPAGRGQVPGVEPERWALIRSKLATKTLTYEDIEGTSLIDLLEEVSYGNFYEDDDPCEYLEGFLELPEEPIPDIYFVETWDGWVFCATEEEFKRMLERDWCDYEWDSLDDEMLHAWIERLIDKGILRSN